MILMWWLATNQIFRSVQIFQNTKDNWVIWIKSNEANGGYEHISLFQYCPKCQVLNPGHFCDSSPICVHDKKYIKRLKCLFSWKRKILSTYFGFYYLFELWYLKLDENYDIGDTTKLIIYNHHFGIKSQIVFNCRQ